MEQSVHSLSLSRIKPTLHSQLNPAPSGMQIEFGNAEHAFGELNTKINKARMSKLESIQRFMSFWRRVISLSWTPGCCSQWLFHRGFSYSFILTYHKDTVGA